jgi:hypothetical protein
MNGVPADTLRWHTQQRKLGAGNGSTVTHQLPLAERERPGHPLGRRAG